MAKPEFFFGVVLQASECRSVSITVKGNLITCFYPEVKKNVFVFSRNQCITVHFPCCHGDAMSSEEKKENWWFVFEGFVAYLPQSVNFQYPDWCWVSIPRGYQ